MGKLSPLQGEPGGVKIEKSIYLFRNPAWVTMRNPRRCVGGLYGGPPKQLPQGVGFLAVVSDDPYLTLYLIIPSYLIIPYHIIL